MRTSILDATLVGETGAAVAAPFVVAPILVLGVGNVLIGDEGVGIHAIRHLEAEGSIPGVRFLDGGTGGVNLLAEFEQLHAIILLDATRDGRPDGRISYLRPLRVGELPRGLGAHDFGLKDLFAASALIGRLPELHLYTVSVSTIRPMCLELSDAVAAAVPPLAWIVRGHASRLVTACGRPPHHNSATTARILPMDAQPIGR
jgi:hydrogenase maturation protease